jgi:predicted XRE-type DNA-binding protein
MKLRSALMRHLRRHVRDRHWEPAEAARAFRVTEPQISDLLRGKISLLDLDALISIAVAAGLRIEMRVGEFAQG